MRTAHLRTLHEAKAVEMVAESERRRDIASPVREQKTADNSSTDK
jgi:hypothetical protein